MAFLQKLFNPSKLRRQTSSKSSYNDTKLDWKKPQFDGKSIRLVLFQDTSTSGRKLIFDSKAVKEDEKMCRWIKCQAGAKLHSVREGQIQQNVAATKMYQYNKTSSDSKMFEEIMFGAEGVAYKGTSLKVHVTRTPPQLMLTKVFVPARPKRSSAIDGDEPSSFSSVPDLVMHSRSSTLDSRDSIAQSVPMDVPSPKHNWVKSIDLIDEDSGLASLTSSGSFYAPSPGSLSDSCNSLNLEKRWHRGQWTSLDKGLERRRSQHDVLAELTSPRKPNKVKFALGIIFDTTDVQNNNANRLFESFFFSHIALLESHLEHLRQDIEKAYFNRNFHPGVIEAYELFKRDIIDLYTAPRLCEPVWLNMMSYTSYRYMLCEKFLKEFVALVTKFDSKSNNFFMSTLVTAVLTHHLAWVPTVMPAGGSPSGTYLDKHSAKWVDTLAKSHPYNPLWAQLGDLYGAIGFPLKLSRTVIVGKRAELVKKLLFILSYFIRCSDILETSEIGSLSTYLEKVDFSADTPIESIKNLPACTPMNEEDRQLVSSPTPVNSEGDLFRFEGGGSEIDPKSFQSLPLDSLLDSSEAGSRCRPQSKDYNSNNRNSGLTHSCEICDSNRTENKVGNSTFYVNSEACLCDSVKGMNSVEPLDVSSLDSDKRSEIQKKKEGLKLTLKLPKRGESPSLNSDKSTDSECKLSAAEIVEDTKIERADHHRKCVTNSKQPGSIQTDRISVPGYDIKIPSNVNKVLTHEEIRTLFRQKGSNSMFNEYFDEEGIEAKTIDDVDEKDRLVDLPKSERKLRFLSGDGLSSKFDEDQCKTPSLPDLTACGRQDWNQGHRVRLGSLGNSTKLRKSSLTRQISESANKPSKNVPGRCRPVTPTEYGKRRHVSSTSSFDIEFLDPRAYCHELPMPNTDQDGGCSSQKDFDKNFGRSLLADFSDHYMSDFVLHGTSDKHYREKLVRDLQMAMQYSVLDEPIAEAVVVVADTDTFKVDMYSSQHIDRTSTFPVTCMPSHLISNLIESVVSMAKLKMSPEFCMMHLEDRLQEIYFKSKMMAEYLKKNKNVQDLLAMFGFERSDLPLLVAIAGTHTPNFPLVCLS